MVRYSQQITQWFTGSPIIRGHTLPKELQYMLKVTCLKGNSNARSWAPWSKFRQPQHKHAVWVGEDRRRLSSPNATNSSDYAEQAGWGSLAPWREKKARPGRTPLFLHTRGEHMLCTFRSRTVPVPQWGLAPPTLSPLPKEPCSHSSILSEGSGSIPEARWQFTASLVTLNSV